MTQSSSWDYVYVFMYSYIEAENTASNTHASVCVVNETACLHH